MLGADVCLEGFGEQQQQSYTKEQEEHMLQEAVQAAEEADIVVLAIGEDRLQSGEATSNANSESLRYRKHCLIELRKSIKIL